MEALPNAHSHDPNQKLQAHKGAALPHSVQQKQQKKQKQHHNPMGLQQQQQQPMGERLEAFYSTLCRMESAWAHHRSAALSASPRKKDSGQSLSVAGSRGPFPRPLSPPSFRHPLSPSVRPLSPSVRPLTHSSTSLLSSSRSASNLLRSTTPPHTPRSQRSNRSNRDGVSDRGHGWLKSSGAGADSFEPPSFVRPPTPHTASLLQATVAAAASTSSATPPPPPISAGGGGGGAGARSAAAAAAGAVIALPSPPSSPSPPSPPSPPTFHPPAFFPPPLTLPSPKSARPGPLTPPPPVFSVSWAAKSATATTVAARSAAIIVAGKPAPSAALVTRSLSSPSASMSLADVVSLTHHSSNEDESLRVGVGGNVSKFGVDSKQAKAELTAFLQTTDFDELVAFQAKIESLLQDLTDETQVLQRFEGFPSSKLELLVLLTLLEPVLQRFEGFPSSKLELLRASASLHLRLSALSHDLHSALPMGNGGAAAGAGAAAAVAAPASVAAVGVCLDRCERLFDRVRREVEAVERSREEDAKKFAAQRLPYSGGAIERVKAAAVRLSSRLLELSAQQESMKLRASVELVDGRIPVYDVPRVKAGLFLLWRCFQFAFRAYNFAGGQDETAEELSLTVAKEMEAYPAYMWG
ncbi:unnamed protein product [Closterium sp. Naga37s-1]|nr:unnamed protein product [Closterium sp. Naga37s-1]